MAFLYALPGAIAEGLIWGLMGIGVYISYKILDIADLTVDGSICTGACVCAVMLGGGIVYYIVYNFVILLGLRTDYLKMLSAIIVAIFLAVPYLKGEYFTRHKSLHPGAGKNAGGDIHA